MQSSWTILPYFDSVLKLEISVPDLFSVLEVQNPELPQISNLVFSFLKRSVVFFQKFHLFKEGWCLFCEPFYLRDFYNTIHEKLEKIRKPSSILGCSNHQTFSF